MNRLSLLLATAGLSLVLTGTALAQEAPPAAAGIGAPEAAGEGLRNASPEQRAAMREKIKEKVKERYQSASPEEQAAMRNRLKERMQERIRAREGAAGGGAAAPVPAPAAGN